MIFDIFIQVMQNLKQRKNMFKSWLQKLREDAKTLSGFLEKPLWDATA